MNFFPSFVLFSVFVTLTLAGHVHHKHSEGNGAVAVHYSVVTEHKAFHGGQKAYEGHMGHEGQHGHGGHRGHEGHLGHEVQHGHGEHKGHKKHHDYNGHHSASHHAWGHDEAYNVGSHDASHDGGHNGDHHDHHAYPKYDFSYGIKDPNTGDIKSHKEIRDGDSVKGSYTIKEADGTTRHVEYTADKHSGFNAVVHTTGHAHADTAKEHGHASYDHGYRHTHGQASSFIMVKKQEERKH